MALPDLLTTKQQEVLQSYLHDNWRILILSGAVRAGKTWISDWLFLLELKRVKKMAKLNHDPHPIVILAGYSSNSIYTNVIASIEKSFGLTMSTDRHGHYHLFGVDIVPAYTGTKRGLGAIRGATSYSAYIDEGSLAEQSVFQEILQRCSVDGSRIIVTTNPDTPVNFLKTDYIDNKKPEARIQAFNFTIDDNTFLSSEYVDALKAQTPSGMYYDRAIKGLWVTGEGAVYKDFDERTMTIRREDLPDNLTYTAGVDWGFDHPTAIEVIGHDDKGNYYLVDEAYGQFEQVDPHWIRVAQQFKKKYGMGLIFFADTARTEHINNFRQHHIKTEYGYKNVLDGIERVASIIKQHKFYVVKDAAPNFINEIYQYIWDEKTGAPVKENDHAQDAVRYCIATPLWKEEQARKQNKNRQRSTGYLNDLGLV
ncbi:MAG: PBSX family phage terminase large subunit [Lactobacillus sp.]|nr:PBSX family phage terminase large subunit [Lactobacillus sp.]